MAQLMRFETTIAESSLTCWLLRKMRAGRWKTCERLFEESKTGLMCRFQIQGCNLLHTMRRDISMRSFMYTIDDKDRRLYLRSPLCFHTIHV
jgi:hypothetical protein